MPEPAGLRFALRDFVRMQPTPGSHRVAVRAGVSVAVPLLAVILLHHPSWTPYAAFGAFTSLYGRNHVHLSRLWMQVGAGAALVLAVVCGAVTAALGAPAWLLVGAGAGLAGLATLVATVLDWHPPGSVFVVFAFGALAATGSGWPDVPVAALVATLSAAFAVGVGAVGAVLRGPAEPRGRRFGPVRTLQPVRALVACAVAGAVATAAGVGHPYWAMVAAVAPLTARTLSHQVLRSGHRVVGTSLGLLTAAPLLGLGLDPVPLVLVVGVLQIATELVVGANYGIAMLFITPMALLMGQLGAPRSATSLLFDRGVETAIGGVVAVGLVVLEHRLAARRFGLGDR